MGKEVSEFSDDVLMDGLTWGDEGDKLDDVGNGGNPPSPLAVEVATTSREEDDEGVDIEVLEKDEEEEQICIQVPVVGMEFPSKDAVYDFYKEYGRRVGFPVRIRNLGKMRMEHQQLH